MKPAVLCLCLLLAAAWVSAAGPARPRLPKGGPARLELLSRRFLEGGNPAVAVAVTDRDGLLWQGAYGLADPAGGKGVTMGTLFEIGSITKGMTAVALLSLADEGRFDPEVPISRYLPWLGLATPDGTPILGRHLLTHTAALPADRDDLPSSLYQGALLAGARTLDPPGKVFRYSNTGYLLLGATAAAIDGGPFPEVLARRVLGPVGMRDSAPAITAEVRPRLAVGAVPFFDDRPLLPGGRLAAAPWFPWDAGDGSVAATAADLAAYARFLLRRGEGPSGRVLSEAAFARLTRGEIASPHRAGALYAFGLNVGQEGGHTVLSHSGGMVGYRAMLLADLTAGVAAVVLTNGPINPLPVAEGALAVARAGAEKHPLPPLPPARDLFRIEHAADYAGTFRGPAGRELAFTAQGDRLELQSGGKRWPISRLEGATDTFLAADPTLALFPLAFGRQNGKVTEVTHGGDTYRPAGAPEPPAPPPALVPYAGHYRSGNPWGSSVRVVILQGELWRIAPGGQRQRLEPAGEATFRSTDPEERETLAFSSVLDGHALRLLWNGMEYVRDDRP